MKRLFSLMVCLVFCVSMMNGQAYRETDKFTGKTTIYSTKRRITMLRAKVLYFYVAVVPTNPVTLIDPLPGDVLQYAKSEGPAIRGCFQEWGHRRWKYLEYHDLVFLADGESIIIDETDHKGNMGAFGGSKLAEYVYFSISWIDFLKLLDADKVEYRLGAYEGKLKSKVLKEMRSFRDEILKGENEK